MTRYSQNELFLGCRMRRSAAPSQVNPAKRPRFSAPFKNPAHQPVQATAVPGHNSSVKIVKFWRRIYVSHEKNPLNINTRLCMVVNYIPVNSSDFVRIPPIFNLYNLLVVCEGFWALPFLRRPQQRPSEGTGLHYNNVPSNNGFLWV